MQRAGLLAENRREVAGLAHGNGSGKIQRSAGVNDVLRIQRSFENTDLAVIAWAQRWWWMCRVSGRVVCRGETGATCLAMNFA